MKIIFLGVGEAFDENLPNNSQLVITDNKTNLLLDCGFTVPTQVWKYNKDKDLIDAIYISHQHGDHFSGLPALLLRMWEGGRERELTIICQKGLKERLKEFMDFTYLGFMDKLKYKINLIEAKEGETIKFNDLDLSFEKTIHSGENLAVKITDGKNIMAYGGDGSPKTEGNFYNNLDLLILETYLYDKEIIGHSTIVSAIKFAEKNNVKCLAMTHINRDLRKDELSKLKIKSDKIKIIIPEPFEVYNL